MKVVISNPNDGKAYQLEVDQISSLIGLKIGETFDATPIGILGYTLELTGGSTKEGVPMRKDVIGTGRKRIMLANKPGFHPKSRGARKRKLIRGNTVADDIIQLNAKVVKKGTKKLEEIIG